MIIKIFADFCDATCAKNIFETYCACHNHTDITITSDDNYTHAVILNTVMPEINIKKENVIGLAWEPVGFMYISEAFKKYAEKHIGKYFIGDIGNLQHPFQERYSYMWYVPAPKELRTKDKVMSIAISHKKITHNQRYRHQIVEYIIAHNLPINIYGNGCKLYEHTNFNRLMGPFDSFSFPYENHIFSICIENFVSNEYFSEKVINPLMCNCVPIYFGSPNIEKYTGDTIIRISGNITDDMNLIVDILKSPMKFMKEINTKTIDNNVNFIKNVDNIFGL